MLTSPLRRARETALAIAERLDLPVTELEDMRELRESEGFGELSLEDQRLRRWSVWMAEHGEDPGHSYRGGETFNEIIGRVRRVQDRLVGDAVESTIAVTHGIFLRFFLMQVLFAGEFRADPGPPPLAAGLDQLRDLRVRAPRPRARVSYATEPWRCFSWMAPAPSTPRR